MRGLFRCGHLLHFSSTCCLLCFADTNRHVVRMTIGHVRQSRPPNQLRTAAAALSSMRGEGDTREGDSIANTARELRKSCDRCGLKKRRCDGRDPCQRCVRIGETCSYSKRRPRTAKPSAQQARRNASAGLQPYGTAAASLKRCRLSPSPATGLVGMQENMFLSDYFGCIGFLRFTSQSNIRETMVNMFAGSVSVQHPEHGDYSTTEQHLDTLVPASELPVEEYARLARDALADVKGPANAEVARAWTILAYMSDFCGDQDNFNVHLQRANAMLYELQEKGNETLPEGLSEAVVHGEAVTLFVGDVGTKEVEMFCSQEQANPEISEVATEGDISRFVMRSYRSFEQDFYENVVEHRPAARILGSDGEPYVDVSSADPVGADLRSGPRPHFFASVMREGADLRSSGVVDMMTRMTRMHSRRFQQIEQAAGRSSIREGVGGFVINGSLIFEKIARKDIGGALGNLGKCGEVLQRYPGLCRFTMWAHVTHMLMSYLAIIDGPRARDIYGQMRAAYNCALRPGAHAIPIFQEWQGLSSYCDNYNCRLVELMVMIQLDDASCCSPPRECAAEAQEKGPRDAPVDSRQQGRRDSATGSREENERHSAVVTEPAHEAIINNSRSKRESERVPDEGSFGCMENVLSCGRWPAPTQPQDPATTSSLFRKVGSEPIVISDFDCIVTEETRPNRCTDMVGQAAEAMLSFSAEGRAMIGETEDVSIGVEDWLDVNHAMSDTADRGLGLK